MPMVSDAERARLLAKYDDEHWIELSQGTGGSRWVRDVTGAVKQTMAAAAAAMANTFQKLQGSEPCKRPRPFLHK